jgi:5-methylcytosine-specific restriction endonuclease McrA
MRFRGGEFSTGTTGNFQPELTLRLDPKAYRQLCREVLERDGWRCQSCGRMDDLQVHHIRPRSRQGDDAEENLIALCATCHQKAHQ